LEIDRIGNRIIGEKSVKLFLERMEMLFDLIRNLDLRVEMILSLRFPKSGTARIQTAK